MKILINRKIQKVLIKIVFDRDSTSNFSLSAVKRSFIKVLIDISENEQKHWIVSSFLCIASETWQSEESKMCYYCSFLSKFKLIFFSFFLQIVFFYQGFHKKLQNCEKGFNIKPLIFILPSDSWLSESSKRYWLNWFIPLTTVKFWVGRIAQIEEDMFGKLFNLKLAWHFWASQISTIC